MANASAMTSTLGSGLSLLDGLDLSKRDDSSPVVIRLNAAFIAVVGLVVSLRIFVRAYMVRALGVDDVLMIFAAVTGIVLSGLLFLAVQYGLGKHVWLIASGPDTIDVMVHLIQTLFICQIFYITSISLTKASIIACYLRNFPHETFRLIMKVIAFFVGAMWICSIFATIFQCTPISGAWDFTLQKVKCYKVKNFYYAAGAINIVIDVLLCTIPLPLLWRLKISAKEKVIVSILFGFGAFACISCILRLTTLQYLNGVDLSSQIVSSATWSVAEVVTGIACASVPSLRPLFNKVIPSLVSRQTRQIHEMKDFATDRRESIPTCIPSARDNPASEDIGSEDMESELTRMSIAVPKNLESEQSFSSGDLV